MGQGICTAPGVEDKDPIENMFQGQPSSETHDAIEVYLKHKYTDFTTLANLQEQRDRIE